jgi:hypothetical protein
VASADFSVMTDIWLLTFGAMAQTG